MSRITSAVLAAIGAAGLLGCKTKDEAKPVASATRRRRTS